MMPTKLPDANHSISLLTRVMANDFLYKGSQSQNLKSEEGYCYKWLAKGVKGTENVKTKQMLKQNKKTLNKQTKPPKTKTKFIITWLKILDKTQRFRTIIMVKVCLKEGIKHKKCQLGYK